MSQNQKIANVTFEADDNGWHRGVMHDVDGALLGRHQSSSLQWLQIDMRGKLTNPDEWEITFAEEGVTL